ncbi:unnamed protein product [Didymodactylos carnosus]|uniref:non-specific serine/threonine protein kinase n=1 Tax=Didymodactylos carnosus TaxID=1234261 RepID=A0A815XEH1_9BILA|nr:unnamed protein product [Didymodactylos carnosus]CAF4417567.1 unnamed protein product [Didymodactylos carnosus]
MVTSGVSVSEELGSSGFVSVYAEYASPYVVIKRSKFVAMDEQTKRPLETADCQSLVRYYRFYTVLKSDIYIYLIIERCQKSFEDLLKDPALVQISPDEMIFYHISALHGLRVLHSLGIVHGNIKPSNILLRKTERGFLAVLTDFGLFKFRKSVDLDKNIATSLYRAPEVKTRENLSEIADIFSIGATLSEILCMGSERTPLEILCMGSERVATAFRKWKEKLQCEERSYCDDLDSMDMMMDFFLPKKQLHRRGQRTSGQLNYRFCAESLRSLLHHKGDTRNLLAKVLIKLITNVEAPPDFFVRKYVQQTIELHCTNTIIIEDTQQSDRKVKVAISKTAAQRLKNMWDKQPPPETLRKLNHMLTKLLEPPKTEWAEAFGD